MTVPYEDAGDLPDGGILPPLGGDEPHPDCTARFYVHRPHQFVAGIDKDGLTWAECSGLLADECPGCGDVPDIPLPCTVCGRQP